MASIIAGSINLEKIDKAKIFEGKKGKYYPVTVVLNNEPGNYGDSGYIQTEQTKEERDAKQPKTFLGNVKVVWTDGQNVAIAARENPAETPTVSPTDNSNPTEPDLPF